LYAHEYTITPEWALGKIAIWEKGESDSLPEQQQGEQQIILSLRTEEQKTILGNPNPLKLLTIEIKNDIRLSLTLPVKLSSRDPLIIAAKERLALKESFLFNCKGVVSCSPSAIDIRVAPKKCQPCTSVYGHLVQSASYKRS
jgi:hypothetical protein